MSQPRAHKFVAVAPSPAHPVQPRPAFTMAEVLFAIIVLGIGLILLAAAFPIGIVQTKKTQDTTMAGLVARLAYDQMTKVPGTGVRPDLFAAPPSWNAVPLPAAPANAAADRYTGRPLVMGLFDGIGGVSQTIPWSPAPDLTLKLLYPYCTLGAASVPQRQDTLTSPITTESFLTIWGFRNAGTAASPVWQENVQWVYPADRRYYWYAYYRQMYDQDLPGTFDPTYPQQVVYFTRAQLDHITRRTYRVLIVVCRLPEGQQPVPVPEQARATQLPLPYADRWTVLAPTSVPGAAIQDGVTTPWVSDAASGGPIAGLISAGKIRRGGIVVDTWGQIYQIVDFTTDRVRLDRGLKIPKDPATGNPFTPAGTVADAAPLWFNPNAIAVFPTIMTKQADMP